MLTTLHRPAERPAAPRLGRLGAGLYAFLRRRPLTGLVLLVVFSNVWGSVFNFAYNNWLIVQRCMDARQQAVFWGVVSPAYNLVAYPVCLGLMFYILWPLRRCLCALRAGAPVPMGQLERCRVRLINLPAWQVAVNGLGWLPGALVFPWLVCWLGGDNDADEIWVGFLISFSVSALLTTVQTFFLFEAYLIAVVYPDLFQDSRPAEVPGALRLTYRVRLMLMWVAVALVPLLALLAVAYPLKDPRPQDTDTQWLVAVSVATVGMFSGGIIFYTVGRGLLTWIRHHAAATEQIALGNYRVRVSDRRPDEWGRLTDRFNDMAVVLQRAEQVRQTFGQVVHPEVRDEILERYACVQEGESPSLGGEVREITVLFADIRGFTRRSAGEDPEQIFRLLHSFLTHGVAAVEEKQRGQVNKFLGDGFMALFGAGRRQRSDHADLAVAAALELEQRLRVLNRQLTGDGQAPLAVGVGIHSGPALVGCIGATLDFSGGRRFEFGAIGETVNVCQRIEQLTKTCGGPILLSEHTQARLKRPVPMAYLGPQQLQGCEGRLGVYRVAVEECIEAP